MKKVTNGFIKNPRYLCLMGIITIGLISVVATGCGDGGNGGGAEEVDTTPPAITSTSPDDGATKVSVLSDIEVTFSEGLDGSTVTTTGLTFRDLTAKRNVSGTISYNDSNRTITFSPSKPLVNNSTYELTVSGIKDSAGNEMSPPLLTITFSTYKNPHSRIIYYSAGSVDTYYTYTLDASGNKIQWVWYNGPGADGVWFTDDDDLEKMYYYETDF